MKIKLTIVPQEDGKYVVRREGGTRKQHAHISTYRGCEILIECIDRNKLPRSKYLNGSCERLLTIKEYKNLKKPKQKYFNINKGVRKKHDGRTV